MLCLLLMSLGVSITHAQESAFEKHLERERAADELRRQGVPQVKKQRKLQEEEQEKALEAFRREKAAQKAPLKDLSEAYKRDLKKRQQEEDELEAAGRQFSFKRRAQAEKNKKSELTEVEELGLVHNKNRVDWRKRKDKTASRSNGGGGFRSQDRDQDRGERTFEAPPAPEPGAADSSIDNGANPPQFVEPDLSPPGSDFESEEIPPPPPVFDEDF